MNEYTTAEQKICLNNETILNGKSLPIINEEDAIVQAVDRFAQDKFQRILNEFLSYQNDQAMRSELIQRIYSAWRNLKDTFPQYIDEVRPIFIAVNEATRQVYITDSSEQYRRQGYRVYNQHGEV